MKIADVSAIQAEVKVDEADVAKITLGQKADVFAAAYPDTALAGTVERIALTPTVEGQGRSYKVTLAIQAPAELELRSGMSARAVIFLGDGQNQLAVPVEAVVTESPEKNVVKKFVWVDVGGKARKIAVTTGLSDDRWEAIESGLKAGDRVIAGPARTLRRLSEGAGVRQRDDKNTPAGDSDGNDE